VKIFILSSSIYELVSVNKAIRCIFNPSRTG